MAIQDDVPGLLEGLNVARQAAQDAANCLVTAHSWTMSVDEDRDRRDPVTMFRDQLTKAEASAARALAGIQSLRDLSKHLVAPECCATCVEPIGPGEKKNAVYTCDRETEDKAWCGECFDHTPCGKGEHGEGCETMAVG